MEFDQYRRLDGVNWSSLKLMASSPRHYQYRVRSPQRDRQSLSLGRAVHCAILEPDKYQHTYIERPRGLDLRTQRGREWREEHSHMEVVSDDVAEIIQSITKYSPAMRELEGCSTEYTIQWTGHLKMPCKARLDAVGPDRIIDVKTSSQSLDRFHVEAARYLYHGQLAFYLDGATSAGVVTSDHARASIIAVETRPPYDAALFLLSAAEIEAGRALYRHCIAQLQACMASGLWPGRYPTGAPLSLPMWAEGMQMATDDAEEVW